jgi:hypothetical protein
MAHIEHSATYSSGCQRAVIRKAGLVPQVAAAKGKVSTVRGIAPLNALEIENM